MAATLLDTPDHASASLAITGACMNYRITLLLGVISVAATGCFVPEDAKVGVRLGNEVASKFVFRGMTQVDAPVYQPRIAIALPTIHGDQVRISTLANMDLTNDNGDAWFPQGHAGRFSAIDFRLAYQKQLNDTFQVTAGVFGYNLPNGQEFPNDGRGGPGEERGGTSEVFVTVSANILEATPYFSWHYDFDEVHGAYYRGGLTESFQINDTWNVVLDGSLGYATSAQSDWLYDLDKSGFADLRGKVVVNYQYDKRTTLTAGLHGSSMQKNALDQWFNDVGVPNDDPIWVSLGVNWSF
jgi:hypothetical protein